MKKKTTKKPNHANLSPEFNEMLDEISKIDPLLVAARAALIPFDDVIVGGSWGPQSQAKDYDPDEEPHFSIDVQNPNYQKNTYRFRFTRGGIEMTYWELTAPSQEEMVDPPVEITLPQLFEFLRQLPRGAYSFIK
jgi:hypothetical protein